MWWWTSDICEGLRAYLGWLNSRKLITWTHISSTSVYPESILLGYVRNSSGTHAKGQNWRYAEIHTTDNMYACIQIEHTQGAWLVYLNHDNQNFMPWCTLIFNFCNIYRKSWIVSIFYSSQIRFVKGYIDSVHGLEGKQLENKTC